MLPCTTGARPGNSIMMFSPYSRKPALVTGSEAFAQSHQQKQRAHSPGDSEHGEKRTQLVRP